MNFKDFVIQSISPIEDGRTTVMDCPECGGKGKFTATVEGTIVLYNCYRASCDTRGGIPLSMSPEERINALKRQKEAILEAPWSMPNYFIDGIGDSECANYMKNMHMWDAYKGGLFRPLYDPALRRFIFPIKNVNGQVVGAIGRTLSGANPKNLNYNNSYSQPFICGGDRKYGFLVEDCASAVSATRNPEVSGIALLGTSIRNDFIRYLSPYSRIYIALDPDAYIKSIKLRDRLTTYLRDVRIIKLPNDIKNLSDEEFLKLSL